MMMKQSVRCECVCVCVTRALSFILEHLSVIWHLKCLESLYRLHQVDVASSHQSDVSMILILIMSISSTILVQRRKPPLVALLWSSRPAKDAAR